MKITGIMVRGDELQPYVDRAYNINPLGEFNCPIRVMRQPIMALNDNGAFDRSGSHIISAMSHPVPPEILKNLCDMTDLIKWVVNEYCKDDGNYKYEGNPEWLYIYQINDSPTILPEKRYVKFAVFKPIMTHL